MRNILKSATTVATSIVLSVSLAGPITAQSLRKVKTPAENPPVSFKGKQYVDSRGCVFIRAGFGGKVTWIPRVNRQRKVFCSAKNRPSLSKSQLASLDGSVPVIKNAPTKVAAAPKRVKRPVATRKVVKIPPKKVVRVAPKPVVRRPVPVAVQPVPQRKVVVVQQPQTHRTAKYTRGGPQAVHPGDLVRGQGRDSVGRVQPSRRPARVAQQAPVIVSQPKQIVSTAAPRQKIVRQTYRATAGAQAVHPGDLVRQRRLQAAASANGSVYQSGTRVVQQPTRVVRRAQVYDATHGLPTVGTVIEQDVTAQGDAQMELVWTNTVPRKLIKRKIRVRKVARVQQTPVRATRSTKAYAPKKHSAAAGKRYVQIGTFGSAANSNRTVSRFQSAGFPVATRKISRNGKALKIVLLGPFGSAAQLQNALRSARGAGFRDAFYVR